MKQYLVGGAVRSLILEGDTSSAHDLDYVIVGGSEQELEDMGMICVGQGFPVYVYPGVVDSRQFALARREKKVSPGYTGFVIDTKEVSLEEDLLRRDLTCNAIAYDEDTGTIIDPYGGVDDLKNGILRPVSNSFMEDPLRALRVVRFYCTKYWANQIHPDCIRMIHEIVDSGEFDALHHSRVMTELQRIMDEMYVTWDVFFDVLEETKLLGKLFPGLKRPPTNKFTTDGTMNLAMIMLYAKEEVIVKIATNLGFGKTTYDFWIVCNRVNSGHMQVANMKSEQIMNIFESVDAFRRPCRFIKALQVCIDTSIVEKAEAYDLWIKLLRVACDVKVQPADKHWLDLRQEIRQERKKAIEKTLLIE